MAAPYSLAPSWTFEGADGNWTTFSVTVGHPAQQFRVLPSTLISETWLPIPQGCEGSLTGLPGCGELRGVEDFNDEPSLGFQSNLSTTWETIGIYDLTAEQNLFDADTATGLYGTDSIVVDRSSAGEPAQLQSQVIAGVATADVWLGILGVGAQKGNFSVKDENLPSLVTEMKNLNITPSLSFGYTAGASYASPKAPGSLIIGGYDQARFKSSGLSFANGGDSNQTLPLTIRSIIAENVPSGTMSLLDGGKPVTARIDSTVSQLYLPKSVCDMFQQAFGLEYDAKTDFYLVNNTAHTQLLEANPSITFTLGNEDSPDSTTNIVFPYAAFALAVGIPFYSNDTKYFPIRVASNEDQQVLGRAFLQEAYLVVDWERNNFTIGQAIHQRTTADIVSITSASDDATAATAKLSTGAIAGIVVAACVVAIGVAVAVFFIVRSRRRRTTVAAHFADYPVDSKDAAELGAEHSNLSEVAGSERYELQDGQVVKHELFGVSISELQGGSPHTELEDTSSKLSANEKPEQRVHELP